MQYQLTATLKGTGTSRYTFTETDDVHAISTAIGEILDRAMNDTIWAKGAIELRNKNGDLIESMDAK